jgi:hypothetical protein
MARTGWRAWAGVVCVAAPCLLASCAASDEKAVTSVAERLLISVSEQQGTEACSLLAPAAVEELEDSSGQPCDQAVLEEDLGAVGEPLGAQVFDTMAQVRFESDTVFLSRFDGKWLVVAAACVPRSGRPYDCDIQVS